MTEPLWAMERSIYGGATEESWRILAGSHGRGGMSRGAGTGPLPKGRDAAPLLRHPRGRWPRRAKSLSVSGNSLCAACGGTSCAILEPQPSSSARPWASLSGLFYSIGNF